MADWMRIGRFAVLKLPSAVVTEIIFSGMQLDVFPNRLGLRTSDASKAERLQDVVINILTRLPHTPITSCGINNELHFDLNDEESGGRKPLTVDRLIDLSDKDATPLTNLSRSTLAVISGLAGNFFQPKRVPRLRDVERSSPAETFVLLEKWEGIVIGADADSFTARLTSSSEDSQIIQAVFDKAEASDCY